MADVRDNRSQIQGTRAHDEAEAGSVGDRPVKIGGKAATSVPTAVSNGDRVDAYFDANGRQVVYPAHNTATGNITNVNDTVEIDMNGKSGVAVYVDGTWSGACTFQATVDGTNWAFVYAWSDQFTNNNYWYYTVQANGLYMLSVGGVKKFRVRRSIASSGTATVYLQSSPAPSNQYGVHGQLVNLGSNNDVMVTASATVDGQTPYFDSDGDNTAQTIKASSGRLYFLEVSNPNSADAYLQIYDESGSITVGTTTPKLSLLVPAGDGTKDGAMDKLFNPPLEFANTIKYACTTTATGNGDPTTGLIVNAGYK